MFRVICIQVFLIAIVGNSVFGINKRKQEEVSKAKKLEMVGDSLLEIEKYAKAVESFYNAANLFEKNKYWIDAVRNYRKTAWCHYSIKSTDSAQVYIKKSAKIFTEKVKNKSKKGDFEESEIYFTQGKIHTVKREIDSALLFLNKGMAIIEVLNTECNCHNQDLARYFQAYGTMHFMNGEYDASLKYNLRSLEIRESNEKYLQKDIFANYFNISLIYLAKLDYEKVGQYCYYIIDNCHKENLIWKARSYNILGIVSLRKNDYNKTIEYYKNALEIYLGQEGPNSVNAAQVMNNIGRTYSLLGDYNNALSYLQSSINIKKEILGKTHPSLVYSFSSMGAYYEEIEEYEKAIEALDQAIFILNKNKSPNYIIKNEIYNNIALIYLNQNNLQKSLQYLQHAIVEIIDGFSYEETYKNPDIFLDGSNFIKSGIKIHSKPALYITLTNKAIVYNKIYESESLNNQYLKESFNTYGLAFKLLDIIRLGISEDESKFELGEIEKTYYQNAVDISLKLDSIFPGHGYSEFAVQFIDKCKSSSLRDQTFIKNALINSGIPQSLIEEENKLSRQLAYYKTEINKSSLIKEIELSSENKKIYTQLSAQFDTLSNYLEKKYPRYYHIKHRNDFNLSEIKSNIHEGELLLEYFITPDKIYITVITKEDIDITTIKIDSSFKETVLTFHKSIRKLETLKYINSNSKLYENLIKPVKKHFTNKSKLIIIPDDYLYYIPFEAIFNTNGSTDKDFRKFNYLITDFEINYNYSIQLWLYNKLQNKRNTQYTGDFIGFAPVFEGTQYYNNDSSEFYRSKPNYNKTFDELKYSSEEINNISELFLAENKKASTYYYGNATEENFKNKINGHKYIHISTHGFVDEDNPDLSGLALYSSGNKEDGLLYASEVSTLEMDAKLVVLSACETGIGKLIQGEGLISITRGFLNAGIPNTIYSLWNVMDKSTSEFMVELYKELIREESYSKALKKVKLKMIHNINTCHPKIWSSFVLIGT